VVEVCKVIFINGRMVSLHDSNPKEEVDQSRPLIGKVLRLLQELFPRDGIGNGYNLSKMHGMTKFQFYMKRYGSAINFY
jgi:hypothetical protein